MLKRGDLQIKILILYAIIASLFFIDRFIKAFFIKNPGFKKDFLFLTFSLTKNDGIAFGIQFNNYLLNAIIFIFIVLLFIILFNLKDKYARIILFLIFLAAVSNFADRIAYGAVVDYISIPHLIAFNIADIMITAGFIIVAISYILNANKQQKNLSSY